jgi:hypothetical protein
MVEFVSNLSNNNTFINYGLHVYFIYITDVSCVVISILGIIVLFFTFLRKHHIEKQNTKYRYTIIYFI